MRISDFERRVSTLALGIALLAGMVPVSAATAQETPSPLPTQENPAPETPPATGPSDQTTESDIVVTGSRVARSGFAAPTPTTIIGEELIEARGYTNAIDAINEVPAFRPSQTPASNSRGVTSSGGSFVDLRGLSAIGATPTARTLVLVDRRRFVPSNPLGQVDINLIPTGLISRTEVVTGGASAAWGSDAVAGVVNFILKDKLEGFEVSAATGVSAEGDNSEIALNLAAGTSFADGRGRLLFGVEYNDNNGVADPFFSRDWGRLAYGNLTLGPRPAGIPSRNILQDVRLSDIFAPGGVIVGGPLDNTTFLGGQTTGVFTPGALVAGIQMQGGGANNSNDGVYFTAGSNLINPIDRYAAMGRFAYDLTDDLGAFVEYNRGETHFSGFAASRRDAGTLIIRQDNAFLPESVRARMVALNLQTINVGRVALDENFSYYPLETDQEVDRVAAGLRGKLGSFRWDAYYQYGRSQFTQRNQFTETANYLSAVDAVRDATGAIVCRPGAAGLPDPGCVPFNIFGRNSPSQAAVDYVQNESFNQVTTKQQVAAINATGDLFSLWAGPVSVAFGFEYREEKVDSRVGADDAARRFDLGNYQPIRGRYDTKEVYGEAVVPLLRDSALGNSLEVTGSIRRTDYSTSGVVTTWKVGGSYEPIDDIRLRISQSRDIRAANLNELFATGTTGRIAIVEGGITRQVDVTTIGNIDLEPERADTFTGGVVLQPQFIPGLRASVDYYDIEISDIITQLAPQIIVDRCLSGVTELCGLITRGTGTFITSIDSRTLNFNSLRTNGVDVEVAYSVPVDTLVPGQITLRALATYVDKLELTDAGGPLDRVRQLVPHWTANGTVAYTSGPFIGTAQVRYIGPTLFDATLIGPDDPAFNAASPISINQNKRSAVAYLNLSAQVRVQGDEERGVQLFAVANNVLDKDPPPFGGFNSISGVLYDLVGRSFRIGIRGKY